MLTNNRANMQEGIPNEEIAKAMQTRQTIKSCRELITAIDAEILVWCKMVSDNVRARIQILTALAEAEQEYADYLHNK